MPQELLFDLTEAPDAPEPLPERRGVELLEMPCRSAVTAQTGRSAAWFDFTANPYRGCEFGCGYCYARASHVWLGHDPGLDFERTLYVKRGFAAALRRDLARRVPPGSHVAFGTATDPYQPIEKREGVLRQALEVLAEFRGLRVSITTKSGLVVRDVDLLQRIARHNAVRVNHTITTPDVRLARMLEPRAPAPRVRFDALRRLRAAGIDAGVFLCPLLPGVTDADHDLATLLREARRAGARFVHPEVVFLKEPVRRLFLRRLRAEYPRVAARYAVWTHTGPSLPDDVRADVHGRVDLLGRRFGLPTRDFPDFAQDAHVPPRPGARVAPGQSTSYVSQAAEAAVPYVAGSAADAPAA